MRASILSGLAGVLVVVVAAIGPTEAAFTATTESPANSWATTTLSPPSGLTLAQSCEPAATIAFRSSTQSQGEGTSLTLSTPAGVVANDVLLAQLVTDSQVTLTAPAG